MSENCSGINANYSSLIQDIPPRPFPTYDELSYDDYLNNHVLPNEPFLLSSKATKHWKAIEEFRLPSSSSPALSRISQPNLSALRKYAHHTVPVANTHQPLYSEFERTERTLGEVLDLWQCDGEAGKGLYVKDWHLMAEIESEGRGVDEIYEVPECLRDDWLNPLYTPGTSTRTNQAENSTTASTSDFRFCYLGPAGTFTPLHRDVYASYSWSANVVGRKIWWLYPPNLVENVVKDGELVFDVRELQDEGGGIKVLQEEGEVIWIPSEWHHQVLNLDFCISFNHNFFASPTLPSIYKTMCIAQERVEDSISDVKEMIIERLGKGGEWEKEWIDEVQGLLERDSGWGWRGFWKTIKNNVMNPPAPESLSPSKEMRNKFIYEVIGSYKKRREWIMLDDVREVVEEIEHLS